MLKEVHPLIPLLTHISFRQTVPLMPKTSPEEDGQQNSLSVVIK
jgi:hypothetical protein